MRKKIFLLAFFIIILCACESAARGSIFSEKNAGGKRFVPMPAVTSDLAAYYPFSGNADDASGNGHNGKPCNADLITDRFYDYQSAGAFNGNNSWIDCGVIDFARGNYTVSGWFLARAMGNGLYMDITGFTDPRNIGAPEGYGVLVEIGDYKLRFLHRFPFDIDGGDNCYTDTRLIPGRWYHFAVVRNNEERKMYIYLNGKLDGVSGFSDESFAGGLHLSIGRRGELVPRYFDGYIDDIAIYKRSLSAGEINLLYDNRTP